MTREDRIRALAASELLPHAHYGITPEMAAEALRDAAVVIDAIDALPVPGERKVCGYCKGNRRVAYFDGVYECCSCNGTGKASE